MKYPLLVALLESLEAHEESDSRWWDVQFTARVWLRKLKCRILGRDPEEIEL